MREERTRDGGEAGFILSETLIALTIIAIAVSLFLAGAAAVLAHVERAGQRAAAALVANDIVAELRLSSRNCPQEATGVRDGLAWQVETECLSQAEPPLHLGLARIVITVRWREGARPGELRLETWQWVNAAR
jgi:Tfp pilus assembly protein PilV